MSMSMNRILFLGLILGRSPSMPVAKSEPTARNTAGFFIIATILGIVNSKKAVAPADIAIVMEIE